MLDLVEVYVRAGDGGNGCIGFRREKFVPKGGPDGGNGGKGGDVYLVGNEGLNTLLPFRYKKRFLAGRGAHGSGGNRTGRNGVDIDVSVPLGTLVWLKKDSGEKELVGDVCKHGERVIAARGGSGGNGNKHYATAQNRVPRLAEAGEPGEERDLILELKLLGDVGLIGLPNVGKSTLLSQVSAARPKAADYPFTTTEAVLGAVEYGKERFVMVEVPGMIEGAHLGVGLGLQFLRHAERCRVFLHLVDGTSEHPGEDVEQVAYEMKCYDPRLMTKPRILAVNKADLPEVKERMREIREALEPLGLPVYFFSALTGEGIPVMLEEALKMLNQGTEKEEVGTNVTSVSTDSKERVHVERQDGVFRVRCSKLERIVAFVDLEDRRVELQLRREMAKIGVTQALEKAGVKPGSRVLVGTWEIEW